MIIVMLGAPGSGKGTVAKLLEEKLGVVHISSGDIFRGCIKNGGDLAEKLNKYMSEGTLVPDELTIEIIRKRLEEPDVENGLILDGFPRTEEQAAALDKLLDEMKKEITVVANLVTSDEEITERIVNRVTCEDVKCGEIYNFKFRKPKVDTVCDICGGKLIQREDDKLETVQKRLKTYHDMSESLIRYYDKTGKLFNATINLYEGKTGKEAAKEIEEYLKS